MNKAWIRFLMVTACLLGLPLTGVALAGRRIAPYLQFPPISAAALHAPFSWLVFVTMAAGLAIVAGPFALRLIGGMHGRPAPAANRFPWWGWCGVAFGACAWIAAWTRFPALASLQRHTFAPLWLAYIVVVNAATYARSGRSMVTHDTFYFLRLFPASAVFWWFFEYLNRFVRNWSYQGIESFGAGEYVLFASVSFATVLPAVLGTRDLLLTFKAFQTFTGRHAHNGKEHFRPALLLVLAVGGLLGLGLYSDYLFPLVWIAPGLVIVALQGLAREETVFAPTARGDWSNVAASAVAALICGFFWEMWNFHSLAKWVYHVPFVDRFHVFEMPLIGFAGYLPFGLECLIIGEALRRIFPQAGCGPATSGQNRAHPLPITRSPHALRRGIRIMESLKYE